MARNNKVDYSTKVLEVKNLKKHFVVGTGRKKITVPAVDNVTFDVYKGEVFGLVGESGCGKTTTGRTMIRLYDPTDGDVILNNERITAGFKGYFDRIKEAKQAFNLEKIKANPLKSELYDLENEKNQKINSLKKQIKLRKAAYAKNVALINEELDKYNNELFSLNNQLTLALADAKYDYYVASKKVSKTDYQIAKEEYLMKLETEKVKLKRKTDGINESLALSKEARETQIQNLKQDYETSIQQIKADWAPKLEELEKSQPAKEEIKKHILTFKEEFNQKMSSIKEEFETKINALVKPDINLINEKIAAEKVSISNDLLEINNSIKNVNETYKTDKAAIIEKAKNNPELYQIDNARIEKAKEEFLKFRDEQKVEIQKAKADNRVKRTSSIASKMQMIFQDPISSLNPRMTVKEIISEGLIIQKVKDQELIDKKVSEVLELVGLSPEYATRYPHEFSGGQRQRIGIARALIINPDVLIADEPISALDVSIQAQVINLLESLKEKLGLTIVFIAHDLSVVKYFCDRIAVMYMGKIIEISSSDEIFNNPIHPYTKSLLSAIPQPDPDFEKNRQRIKYDPSMHDYSVDKPSMVEIRPGHSVYLNSIEAEKARKGEF